MTQPNLSGTANGTGKPQSHAQPAGAHRDDDRRAAEYRDGANAFSALNRKRTLQTMSRETFDLLVIGGGITGAGIALDAVTRGLRTALVEMQDFAAGTSSRSTKLIHGGLRYLKQLEFKVVAEVGRERDRKSVV